MDNKQLRPAPQQPQLQKRHLWIDEKHLLWRTEVLADRPFEAANKVCHDQRWERYDWRLPDIDELKRLFSDETTKRSLHLRREFIFTKESDDMTFTGLLSKSPGGTSLCPDLSAPMQRHYYDHITENGTFLSSGCPSSSMPFVCVSDDLK